MTQEEIEEGNISIAEFFDYSGEFEYKREHTGVIETLHYHDDWLWIMPVVVSLKTEFGDRIQIRFESIGDKWTFRLRLHDNKGKRLSELNCVHEDPIFCIWRVMSKFTTIYKKRPGIRNYNKKE